MIKSLFFILLVVFTLPALAQDAPIDILAQEACDCISKKDLKGLEREALNMELGLCIVESLSRHQEDFKGKLEIDITDQAKMQQLGVQIGMKMSAKCPSVLMMIAEVRTTETEPQIIQQLEGTIKAIAGEEFSFFLITDKDGREHKLFWLKYFEGSERIAVDPMSVIGKKVRVKYLDFQSYSPKVKDYISRKEIMEIEFVEGVEKD